MIRRVRGCEDSLSTDPTPHEPHHWTFQGEQVECDGVIRECSNVGCHVPIFDAAEFCSGTCWEEWHAAYDPETYRRWEENRTGW
ncbi:hypothetical protein [Streptomyces olivaceus]|uniref:hypothetical protein n=1 Tax=Streptomyces olivaceus TaxID=47716 RepID=UPI0036E14ADE